MFFKQQLHKRLPVRLRGWSAEQPLPWDVVAERGRLSQHGGCPLSDDDAARLRERLLVSRPIEELRRAHRYPRREEAAKGRTRKGHRGVPAHGQGCTAHEAFTAQDGREGRGTRPEPEAPN